MTSPMLMTYSISHKYKTIYLNIFFHLKENPLPTSYLEWALLFSRVRKKD